MQTAVLLIMSTTFSEKFTYVITERHLRETVEYLEKNGVRPEYQVHAYSGLKDVKDWLIDKGIAKAPPLMNLMMEVCRFTAIRMPSQTGSTPGIFRSAGCGVPFWAMSGNLKI